MPWTFVESKNGGYAPPPPGTTSLLMVFVNSETGGQRSLISVLQEEYSATDLSAESERLRALLNEGEL